MLISESYKERLQKLAGILSEATEQEKELAFKYSNQRVPYNKDLMIQAINEGREIGVLFQSNNEKYKMPVAKYRIIYPVALGLSKKGNAVIRAFHKMGQSESEAIKTGRRSAEVENDWRLLKVSNIKSMWFTGNLFRGPLEAYNPHDKSMITVEVAADFVKIRKFQDDLLDKVKKEKELSQQRRAKLPFIAKPEEKTEPTPRIIQIPGQTGVPTQKAKPTPKVQIGKPAKPTLTPTQKPIPPIKTK
jgi:mRNA-degrading endonuclease RelE of RelBE toxin-antitoxin system